VNQMLVRPPCGAPVPWTLLLVANRVLGPGMRRVSLVGDDLEGMVFRVGQRLLVNLPVEAGGDLSRPCRIAGFDREELRLDLDLAVSDGTPEAHWVSSARIGDIVVAAPAP